MKKVLFLMISLYGVSYLQSSESSSVSHKSRVHFIGKGRDSCVETDRDFYTQENLCKRAFAPHAVITAAAAATVVTLFPHYFIPVVISSAVVASTWDRVKEQQSKLKND